MPDRKPSWQYPPLPLDNPEWYTATGRRKVARWNNNTGCYEPDPDDH